MTDLRTAAQQALEALTSRAGDSWTRRFARDRAIEALEAALAEPVQEPVAWVRLEAWKSGKDWPDDCFAALPAEGLTPLYTAPPQRKPLTQEEIPALAEKAWTPSVYCDAEALLGTDGLVALVRAVEQAHGIKE